MAFTVRANELVLSDSFNIEQVKECWSDLKATGLQELRLLHLKELNSIDLAGSQIVFLVLRECPGIQVILPTNTQVIKLLGLIGLKGGEG